MRGIDERLFEAFGEVPGDNKSKQIEMKACLDEGANPNAKQGVSGMTPLHMAVEYIAKNLVQLLLDNDADVDARDRQGRTPLHLVDHYETPSQKGIAQLLIDYGADIDARDNNGNTPLHYAVRAGSSAGVRFFRAQGADLNVKNNDGKTPLEEATALGKTNLADLLRPAVDNGEGVPGHTDEVKRRKRKSAKAAAIE